MVTKWTLPSRGWTGCEHPDGRKEWWMDGKRHREDGPAIIEASGSKEWWMHGRLHRENGPAVERTSGYKSWYLNGIRHREDGPAVEFETGGNIWYWNGKLHREDGPAYDDHEGTREWYIRGKQYTYEEFCEKLVIVEGISPGTAEIKMMLRIKDGDPIKRVKELKKILSRKKRTLLVKLTKAAIAVFGKDNKEISDFLISKLNLSFNTEEIDNIFSYHHSNIFDLEEMSDIFGEWNDDNW